LNISGGATGGLVGIVTGITHLDISRSYFTGNITSDFDYVGGLLGVVNGGTATIGNCYTSGTYTGIYEVGGLVGRGNSVTISNSYSTAALTGNGGYNVGGLVGTFTGTISGSFFAGSIGGTSTVKGGLVGENVVGTITNSYYDVYLSGQSSCAGSGSITGCIGVNIGNSTPDYFKNNKTNAPLNGWSFSSIWKRTAAYPVFGTDVNPVTQTNPSVTPISGTSTSGTSTSVSSPPSCGNSKPFAPDLFQINTDQDHATLYFAPAPGDISSYFVAYGFSPGDMRFGVEFAQGRSDGVLSYTINCLSPNTKYYFIIRGGNGCMPGDWSGYLDAKTTYGTLMKFYKYH